MLWIDLIHLIGLNMLIPIQRPKRTLAEAIDNEIVFAHATGISLEQILAETEWPAWLVHHVYSREDLLDQTRARIATRD